MSYTCHLGGWSYNNRFPYRAFPLNMTTSGFIRTVAFTWMLFYFRNVLLENLSIVYWQLDHSENRWDHVPPVPGYSSVKTWPFTVFVGVVLNSLLFNAWQNTVDSLQEYAFHTGCSFRMFNAQGNQFDQCEITIFNKSTDYKDSLSIYMCIYI